MPKDDLMNSPHILPATDLAEIPYFNITTLGTAVDSVKKYPQLVSKDIRDMLHTLESRPNQYQHVLQLHESMILFDGLTNKPDSAHRFRTILCLNPQAMAIEYTPPDE